MFVFCREPSTSVKRMCKLVSAAHCFQCDKYQNPQLLANIMKKKMTTKTNKRERFIRKLQCLIRLEHQSFIAGKGQIEDQDVAGSRIRSSSSFA